MDLETKMVALVVTSDGSYQREIERLQSEGWQIRHDIPAVTVYHLVRMKPEPVLGGLVKADMKIDDDKVFIMGADGKIRKN
jgi:hypothetical protein